MRKQHGNEAMTKAAERLDALYDADDREGYGVWCQIVTRIAKLGPVIEDGTTCH
jgi:hypothetical protein